MRVYPLPPNFKKSPHYKTYFGQIFVLRNPNIQVDLPCGYELNCWFKSPSSKKAPFKELVRSSNEKKARSEIVRLFWEWYVTARLDERELNQVPLVALQVTEHFQYTQGLPKGLRLWTTRITGNETDRVWTRLLSVNVRLRRAVRERHHLT